MSRRGQKTWFDYHRAGLNETLYSNSMSTVLAPLLITLALSAAAFWAHRSMNQLHRRLLEAELEDRDYDELSDQDRFLLNEVVSLKFQQFGGGKLASFVLLYAYPTLYFGEKVLGRNRWSAVEVFGGSSIFYFLTLVLAGFLMQTIGLG